MSVRHLRKPLRGEIVRRNFDLHSISSVDCVPRLRVLVHRAGNLFNGFALPIQPTKV